MVATVLVETSAAAAKRRSHFSSPRCLVDLTGTTDRELKCMTSVQ